MQQELMQERTVYYGQTGALVVVAGLSSRMDGFKPLLPLGDKTIIEKVVETLLAAGIVKIVLVTGYQAAEIEKHLAEKSVSFVRNDQYADTQMFESVKIGLREMAGQCDQFFFLPGDIPLFRCHTLKAMLAEMHHKQAGVVFPSYMGKQGHPVLAAQDQIDAILTYEGKTGLKGALAGLNCSKRILNVPDPGILMDADTPEDYRNLMKYNTAMDFPSQEACLEILRWFEADERIIEHGRAVAEAALELADSLAGSGHALNRPLIEAAALLHDVARREKNHARCGSEWLVQLGFPAVAEVVAAHMDIPMQAIEQLDERAVVYLADKLVIGNSRVTIDHRFGQALTRFGNDPQAAASIRERMDKAYRIAGRISRMTGR